MNDALRMDDDFNAVHLNAKKPMCFDCFQALIEQGCGIDCYLLHYVPHGMFYCLFWCDGVEVFSRLYSKWYAVIRDGDAFDLRRLKCLSCLSAANFRGPRAAPTFQSLKNGIVLGVHRQNVH